MKIAIMKLGANITFGSNNASAANADILYFLRQLEIDDHDITIVTHQTRNTRIPKRLKFIEIQSKPRLDDFDLVLLFNGSLNFFGGAMDPNVLALYSSLRNTRTPIAYINTDGALYFKQLWPSIWKRTWAQNLIPEDYWIDPDRVTYINQGRDNAKLRELIASKEDAVKTTNIGYYPLSTTIMAKHGKFIRPNPIPFNDRKYDLGFGGYTRNTHKRKRIEHYFNQEGALLFGNLRGVKAPKATIQAKCSYQHFIKMMHHCKSTVIIGDLYYNDNFFTMRMYESILADCIVYVDHQMDTEHFFYGHDCEFYITSPSDMNVNHAVYRQFQDYRDYVFSCYDEARYRMLLVEVLEACRDPR